MDNDSILGQAVMRKEEFGNIPMSGIKGRLGLILVRGQSVSDEYS